MGDVVENLGVSKVWIIWGGRCTMAFSRTAPSYLISVGVSPPDLPGDLPALTDPLIREGEGREAK